MRRNVRITAWLLLLAIAVLSLIPPSYRPVIIVPHSVEHLAVFLATGLAFGFGYSYRYLFQIAALILFTAAIEIAQLWVPGRHARFSDFLINALGVGIGVSLGFLSKTGEAG
jgi:VanZ family protein